MRALAFLTLGALCVSTSAAAQDVVRPYMATLWRIVPPASFDPTERVVSDKQLILKQKLLPSGLAVLTAAARHPESGAEAEVGTQLFRVTSTSGTVYCAFKVERTDKAALSLCLIDKTGDGRFDQVFETAFHVATVPHVQDRAPKRILAIDVPYEVRPPEEVTGEYWVGVQYRQYFNIYGNRMLFTCFGNESGEECLSTFDKVKSKGTYPAERIILGARIVFVAPEGKSMRVRVDAPMAEQPFSVRSSVSTTMIPIRVR